MRIGSALGSLALGLVVVACNTGPKSGSIGSEPKPAEAKVEAKPAEPKVEAKPAEPKPSDGSLRLGAAIESSAPSVALAEVAKKPDAYVGKTFATTGTVTAVCQHMGCWMEIKDDASAAHIKMAGHAFFVPKTASGHKAKVLAKLEKSDSAGSCEGEGHDGKAGHNKGKGCRAEAETQLGRPLAKLELVAEGVELM
jgi:Rieske Fe-S protein